MELFSHFLKDVLNTQIIFIITVIIILIIANQLSIYSETKNTCFPTNTKNEIVLTDNLNVFLTFD